MNFLTLGFFPHARKKYVLSGIIVVFFLDYFGLFAHLFEMEFTNNFHYPYDGDISSFILKIRQGLKPEMDPINVYDFAYVIPNTEKCQNEELRLVYIVKSSVKNFERRKAIRRTWGFEKRFSDVAVRTVFILGNPFDKNLQKLVIEESEKYNDVVQINFKDSYYNNTIKTMSAIKWITEYCSKSRFYFFSDDDMYVSTKNVLRFLRNPAHYPDYLQLIVYTPEEKNNSESVKDETKISKANYKSFISYDLPKNVILFAGFVFVSSPHRHKSSKWYISLKEYPYNMWPPYVTAGAFVLSREALLKLYYTSFYTKHFRFDDIYLGILALKAGIEPFHCDQIHFYKKEYSVSNYKYLIASHGYGNVKELEKVWNEQREAGNA